MRGIIEADYIHSSLHPQVRADKVKRAVEKLATLDFDAIAVRGMSGAIIGGAIAHALDKPILLARKNKHSEESHHSCMSVEGPLNWSPLARYVIVDDFVSSGNTLRRVQDAIGHRASLFGTYLYRDEEFTPVEYMPDRWLLSHEQPEVVEPKPGSPMTEPVFDKPAMLSSMKPLRSLTVGDVMGVVPEWFSTASMPSIPLAKTDKDKLTRFMELTAALPINIEPIMERLFS